MSKKDKGKKYRSFLPYPMRKDKSLGAIRHNLKLSKITQDNLEHSGGAFKIETTKGELIDAVTYFINKLEEEFDSKPPMRTEKPRAILGEEAKNLFCIAKIALKPITTERFFAVKIIDVEKMCGEYCDHETARKIFQLETEENKKLKLYMHNLNLKYEDLYVSDFMQTKRDDNLHNTFNSWLREFKKHKKI